MIPGGGEPTANSRGVAEPGEQREPSALVARANKLLDRFRDRPLVDLAMRVYHRDREMAGSVVSSALAFRLFLFFVPLVLFVVGLAGFVANVVDEQDVNDAIGVTGSVAVHIDSALSQPNATRWIAVAVGLIGMGTTGRTLSKVVITASCMAWRLPVRAKASPRVIGALIGTFAGIGLVTIVNRIRAELGLGVATVSFLLAFAIYGVARIGLCLLLPRATTDPGALLPGAVLVGAAVTTMQAVSQLYLPDRFSRASELYGAIGATIVVLGWFFIFARALVLGFVVDAVVHERFGSITRVVFGLPVLRLLPRHSDWFRRFFDLETERSDPE